MMTVSLDVAASAVKSITGWNTLGHILTLMRRAHKEYKNTFKKKKKMSAVKSPERIEWNGCHGSQRLADHRLS